MRLVGGRVAGRWISGFAITAWRARPNNTNVSSISSSRRNECLVHAGRQGGRVHGILPVTKTDNGLAVVRGTRRPRDRQARIRRMSQALLAQLCGVALSTALHNQPTRRAPCGLTPTGRRAGGMTSYRWPYPGERGAIWASSSWPGRVQSRQAVNFWQRMMAANKGGHRRFLSRIPRFSPIQQIRSWLPEARRYYAPA